MAGPVSYHLHDCVATITLDDGKVNALSHQVLTGIDRALDHAAADGAAVVLSGRTGAFSAGFDLRVLRAGGAAAPALVRAGFELAARVLSFPRPVVIACTGHAIAMGAFLLLSGDYRIGAAGPYKITANEVAIGLTMPRPAVEICRQRLTPAHFTRAVINAEVYAPDTAISAGFLDCVTGQAQLADAARDAARQLLTLDADAHAATKLRARETALAALRAAIDSGYPAATTATPA